MIKWAFLLSIILVSSAIAEPNFINTKNQIQQLDQQITRLKNKLTHDEGIHHHLNKQLVQTEKNLLSSEHQIKSLKTNILSKQKTLDSFRAQEKKLNETLEKQHLILQKQVRLLYELNQPEPLKVLFNKENNQSINQLMVLNQYLLKKRQQLIAESTLTKQKLSSTQSNLQKEIEKHHQLQKKLSSYQQQLVKNKASNDNALKSLHQEIELKEKRLSEYQHNKENLSKLLKALMEQSATANRKQPKTPFKSSFVANRHKFSLPVAVQRAAIHAANQGVTFYAKEGTTVQAIHSGKVVFSNWLNGYGLLLIIDHGQGFMSLYAHNQSLLKAAGTLVSQGEAISAVGHSGGPKKDGLYFEIRQNGKAISPLAWLY